MLKEILKIFHYKELVKTLVLRQIKVKYKKFLLGYLWTIIEPLTTMFVLMFVIGMILKARTENFSVYLLSGLIPWIFFNSSLSNSTMSLIGNASLIKKIYFPREILTLTTVLFHYINFLLSLLLFIPFILILKIEITYTILFLPVPMIILFLFSYGLALIFSCINVYYRDTDNVVKYMLRILFFLTPIFYSVEGRIPHELYTVYLTLNPLAVIIMLFRSALMGSALPDTQYIFITSLVSIALFFIGYWIFKRNENEVVKRI
jgi:ABC-2 type transport system permease protein